MRGWVLAISAVSLWACVPYPGEAPYQPLPPRTLDGPFPGLDAGASRLESLHFGVSAYGPDLARRVSETAEEAYRRIMVDTNLYSFRPGRLYGIVVYADQQEYRRKTGQPEWSGGVAVGRDLYTFAGPGLERTLAHEMTHLIFHEYMGRSEQAHRWINEGLAVFQEAKAAGTPQAPADLFSAVRPHLRRQPLPREQMLRLVPSSERERAVSLWYAQAEGWVRHLLVRGGRMGFSEFLAAVKDGRDLDSAVASSFPGVWKGFDDFEDSWRRTLQ